MAVLFPTYPTTDKDIVAVPWGHYRSYVTDLAPVAQHEGVLVKIRHPEIIEIAGCILELAGSAGNVHQKT
jgi:hypothetical protein